MEMQDERKTLAELWLRECRDRVHNLKQACQEARERLATLQQGEGGEINRNDDHAKRIHSYLNFLKQVTGLCRWESSLDWYANGEDRKEDVEAINLPALAMWNADIQRLQRSPQMEERWADTRDLCDPREDAGNLERRFLMFSTSVRCILRRCEVWVGLIHIRPSRNDSSETQLSRCQEIDEDLAGNVNFKHVISENERRSLFRFPGCLPPSDSDVTGVNQEG
jgi:hypothetical protein